jgi:hypothetical protein
MNEGLTMLKNQTTPSWLRKPHRAAHSEGELTIKIAMDPLPPFDEFRATKEVMMRFNGEHLEVIARVDNYPHLIFWVYIHFDDLYTPSILPIEPTGDPGSAYAAFFADKTYAGTTGQLEFSFDEKSETLTATLEFLAPPYRFTCGQLHIKGLNPPVK